MNIHNIIKCAISNIIFMFSIFNHLAYAEECYSLKGAYPVSNEIINMNALKSRLVFSKILSELDIQHDSNDIKSITKCFQKFRRDSNQERWQIQELNLTENQRQTILNLITELNIIDDVHAPESFYQYALILGATAPTMKTRIEYFGKEWSNGVRCNEIALLGANRKLSKDRDYNTNILQGMLQYIVNNNLTSTENLVKVTSILTDQNAEYEQKFALAKTITANNPKLTVFSAYLSEAATEADAALAMLYIADIPKEIQRLPVCLVTAPDVKRADNLVFRANTAETIEYWLNNHDVQKTSIVAVSNQPYLIYQQQVLNNILKNQFNRADAIGYQDNSVNKLAKIELYLDTLALFLHNYMKN